MALTICAARSAGFWLSFFASSKHSDEASCPNSEFGGLLNAKFSIFMYGSVFFRAEAMVVSHSFWNSAKGFLEVMLVCLTGFGSGKPLRGRCILI